MNEFEKAGVYYRTSWLLKKPSRVISDKVCITSLIYVQIGQATLPVVRIRHGSVGPVLHLELRWFLKNYKPAR